MVAWAPRLPLDPNLPRDWFGKDRAPVLRPIEWKNKPLASLGELWLRSGFR